MYNAHQFHVKRKDLDFHSEFHRFSEVPVHPRTIVYKVYNCLCIYMFNRKYRLKKGRAESEKTEERKSQG